MCFLDRINKIDRIYTNGGQGFLTQRRRDARERVGVFECLGLLVVVRLLFLTGLTELTEFREMGDIAKTGAGADR